MSPLVRPVPPRSAVALLMAAILVGALGCGSGERGLSVEPATSRADFEFVISAGTGERIDRGEDPAIFPRRLDVRVGQVIKITNEDNRGHVIGPFYVGRGESITQRFASPGTYRGECSAHPDRAVEIRISS